MTRPIIITAGNTTVKCCKENCDEDSLVQIGYEGEELYPLCRTHATTRIAWQQYWMEESCVRDVKHLDWMFKWASEECL